MLAVLLIARMLGDENMLEMARVACDLGMFVLLEAFDTRDLERIAPVVASCSGVLLVGVNSRDLVSLKVVPERLFELANEFGAPDVAESGVYTAAQCEELSHAGYSLALVGTALMSHEHPDSLVRQMIRAGGGHHTVVKICGLTRPVDVVSAVLSGADALGFVLVDSPRQMSPEQARSLVAMVPRELITVGVFRRLTAESFKAAEVAGVDVVQGERCDCGGWKVEALT